MTKSLNKQTSGGQKETEFRLASKLEAVPTKVPVGFATRFFDLWNVIESSRNCCTFPPAAPADAYLMSLFIATEAHSPMHSRGTRLSHHSLVCNTCIR